MRSLIEDFFHPEDLNTNIRAKAIAGLTTFMTMAYIIFVNPAVISQAGMDFGAAMMATCISAAAATIMMGFYASYPVALAALKLFTGKGRGVSWLVYLPAALFILRFVYLKAL